VANKQPAIFFNLEVKMRKIFATIEISTAKEKAEIVPNGSETEWSNQLLNHFFHSRTTFGVAKVLFASRVNKSHWSLSR